MIRKRQFLILLCLFLSYSSFAQKSAILNLNKPEREAWFTKLGFGLFIHWSFDSQLGVVISHSLVGASDDYLDRYFHQLPKTFDPQKFNPRQWAKVAKLAGLKYVVFTTKHHSGFCMYDTKTTTFNSMNTPFGKDITAEVIKAFREEGLAVGVYFSPDDFWYLHENGIAIARDKPETNPITNAGLLKYDQQQLTELMTNYGPIDMVFLDGMDQESETALAKVCWKIQPNVVVTRGAMVTPEQEIPNSPIPSPWEACYTLGKAWQYQPTNEHYKSAREAISMLIEVRAKGGNLLLNMGPTPDGAFPAEQAAVFNEIGLWNFINQEVLADTEPWVVTNEGDLWFLQNKKEHSLYGIWLGDPVAFGKQKEWLVQSVRSSASTKLSVLGQNSQVMEYRDQKPNVEFHQTQQGVQVTVTNGQRIYDDFQWPNPLVFKLTDVSAK